LVQTINDRALSSSSATKLPASSSRAPGNQSQKLDAMKTVFFWGNANGKTTAKVVKPTIWVELVKFTQRSRRIQSVIWRREKMIYKRNVTKKKSQHELQKLFSVIVL
jgi:hypothetical protein